MRFTYRSGQRPLDGYTIKRGVGQGGFGEVYFAVSDGGKEVALKLLHGHSDVELRGIANCLNLKHPNLVHVYDLRNDEHGDSWLVMEYVLGESLAQVINRHPSGLPVNLAKEWFLSLTRAVGYLHDHGVVHRDLKPANIFIENGTLKVGDYGLCKSLHSNQKQTRTVGTVHYMAPEISTGNYSKQIDIYACGIVLHEMLTGNLPFDGESDGEILMKHLTASPDLTKVPMPFRPVIAKALDKNPMRRYSSMAELGRALEGASLPTAVPPGVPIVPDNPLAPPAAPMNAAKPVEVAAVPVAPVPVIAASPVIAAAPALASSVAPLTAATPALPQARSVLPPTFRDRITDLSGAFVKAPLVTALAVIPYALIAQTADLHNLVKLVLLSTFLSWAILIGSGRLSYRAYDSWTSRLRLGVLGVLVGVAAFWMDGWTGGFMPVNAGEHPEMKEYLFGTFHAPPESGSVAIKYLLYFGGVLAAGRWWRAVARDRKEKFSLFPAVAAAFWGLILAFLWPWQTGPVWSGVVPLVLAALAVQAASPWSPAPAPVLAKKLKFRPA